MEGKVLTEFKDLDTVENDFLGWRSFSQHLGQEQQAMASEAFNLLVDCYWINSQLPGYLPVTHPVGDHGEDLWVQVGKFLPVGCREGLGGEGTIAGKTTVALYPAVVTLAEVGTDFFVVPPVR